MLQVWQLFIAVDGWVQYQYIYQKYAQIIDVYEIVGYVL